MWTDNYLQRKVVNTRVKFSQASSLKEVDRKQNGNKQNQEAVGEKERTRRVHYAYGFAFT